MSSSKNRVNSRLRDERLRHRWSQQEVADKIGTTTNNVSRWELGQTRPGPYFRSKLSKLFQLDIEALGLSVVEDTNNVVNTNASVLRRFTEHQGWLLIYDNVEDLARLKSSLPAFHAQGHILLTTNLQVLEPIALALNIEHLSE